MDPDFSHPSTPDFQGYQGKKKAMEENTWNFSGAKPGSEAHYFWPWSINYNLVTWPHLIAREVEKCPPAICSKKRRKRQPLSHDKPTWKLTLKPESEWPAKACWGLFDYFLHLASSERWTVLHHSKSGFWYTQLLFKAQTLLTGETSILSCQTYKAVSFLPVLISQKDTAFSKPEAFTPVEGPTCFKTLIGIQETVASVHHIMFIYISLADFLTVSRSGNKDSVVDPKGIYVVFIAATPATINQSR